MNQDEEAATTTMEKQQEELSGSGYAPDGVDEASNESFPASDPPSKTPITRVGCPRHAS